MQKSEKGHRVKTRWKKKFCISLKWYLSSVYMCLLHLKGSLFPSAYLSIPGLHRKNSECWTAFRQPLPFHWTLLLLWTEIKEMLSRRSTQATTSSLPSCLEPRGHLLSPSNA